MSEFRNAVLEVLSMLNARHSEIVVVETADDLSTVRSRMIEPASRDDEERQPQQRAVQDVEARLRQLELHDA